MDQTEAEYVNRAEAQADGGESEDWSDDRIADCEMDLRDAIVGAAVRFAQATLSGEPGDSEQDDLLAAVAALVVFTEWMDERPADGKEV